MSYEQCTAGNCKSSPTFSDKDDKKLSAMADVVAGSSNGAVNKKVALITGITGQDGSYLAEFLIEKGYEV